MNLEGNGRWVALKFCQFVVPSLNRGSTVLLFSITFVLKYDYEFLTCILKKMTLRGKKC